MSTLKRLLGRVFGPRAPYKELQRKPPHFVGELSGDRREVLENGLIEVLEAEGNAARAFLSMVRYPDEPAPRAALIIDGRAPADSMAARLGPDCGVLIAIDILFFETLTPDCIAHLQRDVRPFYPRETT